MQVIKIGKGCTRLEREVYFCKTLYSHSRTREGGKHPDYLKKAMSIILIPKSEGKKLKIKSHSNSNL